jgi:hypothetical protein
MFVLLEKKCFCAKKPKTIILTYSAEKGRWGRIEGGRGKWVARTVL